MTRMTMRTQSREVSLDVNDGVANQLLRLVREHPETQFAVGSAPNLEPDYDTSYYQRRAEDYQQRWIADRQRADVANVTLANIKCSLRTDLEAGVHPGAIVRKVLAALEHHNGRPGDGYATEGYGTGEQRHTVSGERREVERRAEALRAPREGLNADGATVILQAFGASAVETPERFSLRELVDQFWTVTPMTTDHSEF